MAETNIIRRQYRYMVEDSTTGNHYILNEDERELLQHQLQKGITTGRIGDFLYNTEIYVSPNLSYNIDNLTSRAKKVLYKFIDIAGHGESFHTHFAETISLWRGDYGLSIADLKSLKAPLFRNGSSYIVIDIHITIKFQYKPLKQPEQYPDGTWKIEF